MFLDVNKNKKKKVFVDLQKQVGRYIVVLKALSHQMNLAFDDMRAQFQALIRDAASFFKFFRCSNDFITQIVYSISCVIISLEHIKNLKNGLILSLGRKLTIHFIKNQIHLVRQSFNVCSFASKIAVSWTQLHLRGSSCHKKGYISQQTHTGILQHHGY